jgi:hypothetical protein
MNSSQADPMMFPSLLYGNSRQTRAAWKKVAKSAWEKGQWDGLFETFSPIDETDEPIIIMNDRRVWLSADDERFWHLNWILEASPHSTPRMREWRTQLDLVLEGMEQLWFTVGMLQGNLRHLYFHCNRAYYIGLEYSTACINEVFRPIVQKFLMWLPQLVELAPRFVNAYQRIGLSRFDGAESLMAIFVYARLAGFPVDSMIGKLKETSLSDIPQLLQSAGVLEG